MYEIDSRDVVVELTDAPKPDAGAPLPQLLATEDRLLLAYLVSVPDPHWDGTYANMISSDTEGLSVAIVDFRRASAHLFGSPNDEVFAGHPLASRGLHPYSVFEIQNSSWIRKLEMMNSVHRSHDKRRFMADRHHFIFAFHDTTFECVAKDFSYSAFRGSMRSAFVRMLETATMR